MDFQLQQIPQGSKRGWTVLINGVEQQVSKVVFHSKYGELTYGLWPKGYDGWAFREQGGGGAVTLPWSRDALGNPIVGLLREDRPNMGAEPVLCVIGWFVDSGETHAAAQAREADEEAGLGVQRATLLSGLPTNPNRAFFVADPMKDEGVHAYGLRVPRELLEYCADIQDGVPYFKFKDGAVLGPTRGANVRFYHWKVAVRLTADALARAAIAQLLAKEL